MYNTAAEVSSYHDEKVRLPNAERNKMRQRRDTNRERVDAGLDVDGKPVPYGHHTQGSYAMRTMVQDDDLDYDIDDGTYFRKDKLVGPHGAELSALAVRQMVCAALQDKRFRQPPEVLKNCVRVYYNEGFHVDVPSYREIEETSLWSGQKTTRYELASSVWKSSDPLAVTKWFKERNEWLSPDFADTDGQFCRVVRLLKMFARSRTSWRPNTATGFMITKLAAEHFSVAAGRDDMALRWTMAAIEGRLRGNKVVAHPTLNGENITKDDDQRPSFFQQRLAENLQHLDVMDKPECARADALGAWDKVFNIKWFSSLLPPTGGAKSGGTNEGQPTRPVEKRDGGRYADED